MTVAFKDHFSGHAAAYAQYRPSYPPALANWLGSIAPSRGLALDVGCGSGQLSQLLAAPFERVIATDPSAQQIESAAPHSGVTYRVEPAEKSALADASVDLLTAAQAAHWFDLPAFFTEASRVLKPGGVIALVSYVRLETGDEIEAICARFRLETLDGYWPPERAIVENDYRDIALPFAPIAAPPFAIEVDWPLAALIGYLDTWSAVRAMERQVGRQLYDDVVAELTHAWGDPETRRTIRWPLTILAGRKDPIC